MVNSIAAALAAAYIIYSAGRGHLQRYMEILGLVPEV